MKGAMKQSFTYLKFFSYFQSHSVDLSLANCQLTVQGAVVQKYYIIIKWIVTQETDLFSAMKDIHKRVLITLQVVSHECTMKLWQQEKQILIKKPQGYKRKRNQAGIPLIATVKTVKQEICKYEQVGLLSNFWKEKNLKNQNTALSNIWLCHQTFSSK